MKRHVVLCLVLMALSVTAAFAQFCSTCGAKSVDGATYCIRCGKPLPKEAPVPSRTPDRVVPPPRPWETAPAPLPPVPPRPVPRPRPRPVLRSRSEIRDTYGSLTFFSFSQWRFADDDVKSDFGLTWQYLGLEDYILDPSRPNRFWAELGLHSWTDLGTFPNEVEIGLVNLNFGLVHYLRPPVDEDGRLHTAYVLFGLGHYSASTDFPSLGLAVDEDDWGHCWGLGFINHRLRFEWRRHWVDMGGGVNYDGDQFSLGFRF